MEKNEKNILMVFNWKMNPGRLSEAETIASEMKKGIVKYSKTQVVLCPPFVHLAPVAKKIAKSRVLLGGQNVAWTEKESLTGEISPAQLTDLDVKYCIVGHSERRAYGETNIVIAQKLYGLLKRNIIPILCVGESVRDEKGEYLKVIEAELRESLTGITKNFVEKIVIAYEPIWAIGKNSVRTARAEEIEEIAIVIRRTISDMYGFKKVPQNSILYGGSVGNPKDVETAIVGGGMNGCLVGRASLSAKTALPLVEAANRLAR